MSSPKTRPNNASVTDFINKIPEERKKQDSFTLLKLFSDITGEQPKMWGSSIIGFGLWHYKSKRNTHEGDWPLAAFSPRKLNLTLYVLGPADLDDLLSKLGKYKTSKACLYINKLEDVDLTVLEKIIKQSYLATKKKYNSS